MRTRVRAALVGLLLSVGLMPAYSAAATVPETIRLERRGGTYAVPVRINDAITLPFIIDSGATDVAIPVDVFLTLTRTGTVKRSDIRGFRTFALADGTTKREPVITLHTVTLGNYVLHDVDAVVSPVAAEPLLGQSSLSRLPNWEIDNQRHVLVLNVGTARPERMAGVAAPLPLPPAEQSALKVVRAFYSALGRADGSEASALVIPEKRVKGPFSASEISRFYGSLREPLRLLDVKPLGPNAAVTEYTFVLPSGRRCDGRSVVHLTVRGSETLIERIRALAGC